MAFKTRLTTKGFEEYLERLQEAGKDVDLAADAALAAGGALLLDGMQRRAPVLKEPDPRYRPGHLRDSLKILGPFRNANFHFVDVGLVDVDGETARYGNAQEYGTSSMGAQPYIRPALDEDMRKARAEMKKMFEEELGK